MPEVIGRFTTGPESSRQPAGGTWATLYTVEAVTQASYGIDICNATGADVHVSVAIVPASEAWAAPTAPPPYSLVVFKQRIEGDATDGNVWVMPVKQLNTGDRVAIFTDTYGVTFYGHGIRFV